MIRVAAAVGTGVTLLAATAMAASAHGRGGGFAFGGRSFFGSFGNFGSQRAGQDGFGRMSNLGPFSVDVGQSFNLGGSYGFASSAVSDMTDQCVMEGEGGNQFEPQGATTRADMAVLIGRLMGWGGLQSSGGAPGINPGGPMMRRTGRASRFRDSGSIPSWASSDVQYAAQAGILQGEQNDEFVPNGNVTWAQAAVIIQRIFNVPAVAPAQVGTELAQLPNGSATPAWAQQAVADDVAAGILTGTLAQDYSAGQSIDRADMALFIQNAEAAAAQPVSPGAQVVTGTVVSVGTSSLVLQTACGLVQVPISSNTPVYQAGQTSSLSAVSQGESVLVGVNNGQGVFVDVLTTTQVAPPSPTTSVSGTVTALSTTQITIQETASQNVTLSATFDLASSVAVTGETSSLTGITAGDQVTLTLSSSGQVTQIDVTSAPQTSTVSGTVTAISSSQVTLAEPSSTAANAQSDTYDLASSVAVSGQVSALSDVSSGDQATLTLNGSGQVTAVDVTAVPSTSTVSGTVSALSANDITVTQSNGSYTYALASSVAVSGQVSSLSNVTSGDQVTLTLNSSGQVTAIDVTAVPQTSTVTGTVSTVSSAQITVTVNGTNYTYDLASAVTVTGSVTSLADVTSGDQVSLTLNSSGEVTAIDVTSAPTVSQTVTGTLIGTATQPASVSVATYDSTTGAYAIQTYDLSSAASVTLGGSSSSLSQLAAGEAVSVGLDSAGQAVDVAATALPAGTVTATGVVDNNADGQVGVYVLTGGGHQVNVPDGSAPLAVVQSSGAWTVTALSGVSAGTMVEVIQGAADGTSLLLIEQ